MDAQPMDEDTGFKSTERFQGRLSFSYFRGNLVGKIKVSPCSGSAFLKMLNPIHNKRT